MQPRLGNGRGSASPVWPLHNNEVPSNTSQPSQTTRTFRSPELRDVRMIPRSEEKFGTVTGNIGNRFTGGGGGGSGGNSSSSGSVGGRGVGRGGPSSWNVKDSSRERFGGQAVRGGRRDPPGRHARSFTR